MIQERARAPPRAPRILALGAREIAPQFPNPCSRETQAPPARA